MSTLQINHKVTKAQSCKISSCLRAFVVILAA